jgi:hypothetical protein
MSNRTILELNHDLAHRIAESPEAFGKEIAEYLRATSHDSRDRLRRFGAYTLATVHHSDKITISFNKLT